MIRVFYEPKTGEIVGMSAIEDVNEIPQDSLYSYVDVETLPYTKPFRQGFKVENGQVVVYDFELNEQQEREATKMELLDDVAKSEQYLRDTDYVASKLGEASAEAAITGDNTYLQELMNEYSETIQKRKNARIRINECNQTIASLTID